MDIDSVFSVYGYRLYIRGYTTTLYIDRVSVYRQRERESKGGRGRGRGRGSEWARKEESKRERERQRERERERERDLFVNSIMIKEHQRLELVELLLCVYIESL